MTNMPPQAKPTSVLAEFQDASGPFFGSVCPKGAIKKKIGGGGPGRAWLGTRRMGPKIMNLLYKLVVVGFYGDFLNEKLRMPLIKGLGRLVWPKT